MMMVEWHRKCHSPHHLTATDPWMVISLWFWPFSLLLFPFLLLDLSFLTSWASSSVYQRIYWCYIITITTWTDLPLFRILNTQTRLLSGLYTLIFNHVLLHSLLSLRCVRLTDGLLRFFRRVIVREDLQEVSEYIADYIICMPLYLFLALH